MDKAAIQFGAAGVLALVVFSTLGFGTVSPPQAQATHPNAGACPLPPFGIPTSVAIDPGAGVAFVAVGILSTLVLVVNETTGTVSSSIRAPDPVTVLAVDPSTHHLFVAMANSSLIVVYNAITHARLTTLPVGWDATSMAVDQANHHLFVSFPNGDNVTVIDTRNLSVQAAIEVVPDSRSYATGTTLFDPLTDDVYVAMGDALAVINATSGNVTGRIPLALETQAGSLAADSSGRVIFVGMPAVQTVGVVNATKGKLVNEWYVAGTGWNGNPTRPGALAFDTRDGYLLLTSTSAFNLTVMNGTTGKVVHRIAFQSGPEGLTFDAATGFAYVSLYQQGETQILDSSTWLMVSNPVPKDAFSVTFAETGLPQNLSWEAAYELRPMTRAWCNMWTSAASAQSSIQFFALNGTYNFTVAQLPFSPRAGPYGDTWQPTNGSGRLVVNGHPVTVFETFRIPPGPPPTFLGFPYLDWYLTAAVGVAIALAAVGYRLRGRGRAPWRYLRQK